MQAEAGGDFQTRLARSRSGGDGAGEFAHSAFVAWRELEAALAPIVGARGVAALYQRSLSLNRAAYSFLPTLAAGDLDAANFAALRTALALQSSAVAAAANGALLRTFSAVLGKLIGESLTAQLLPPPPGHADGKDARELP
ncbi:hypothetical protein [Rhodocyclus tenuis]|uniref:Uncharacterized protein n=1 Tax=Rhodocyclus tenuis TaxID=1066 RepID=A0A840GBW0_RHOTE|nr:hypothetical protein [Rhodocyclus tenuis]MBB4245749.1 hypothetical protein [Rhodocyclus tenuis]